MKLKLSLHFDCFYLNDKKKITNNARYLEVSFIEKKNHEI